MLNLLFDLVATQPNASGKRHGGGKYGEIIFKRIIQLGYKPVCYYSGSKWLNPEILSLTKDNKLPLYDIDKESLEDIVKKEKIDKIYSCLPTKREKSFKICKVVGTIHGLRNIELPFDSFYWKYKNNYQIKNIIKWYLKKWFHCKKWEASYKELGNYSNFSFITVSNHSAMAFKSYFPNYKDKEIRVFYSPSTSSEIPIMETKRNDKYFLMVSGNRWEKNNLRAIIALDRLFSYGYFRDYSAIITGVSDANIYKYKIVNPDKFTFAGYVEDNDLEQLYHDAYAFIYPSLNEGFGYPPLEAMRYGKPVLASPFTSIPEICQGAALYFNPYSIEEIMNRILYITNDRFYQEFSNLSVVQYAKITAKQSKDLDELIEYLYH